MITRAAMLFAVLFSFAVFTSANADEVPADTDDFSPIIEKLHPQHGNVVIGDGLATLHLPPELSYLSAEEMAFLYNKLSHNMGRLDSMGSIVPSGSQPGSPAYWYSPITYLKTGRVKEGPLDKTALLERIHRINQLRNEQLNDRGFPNLAIGDIHWSDAPRYDADRHVLYWGLEVLSKESGRTAYVYTVCIIGKSGVLQLILSGPLETLPALQSNAEAITSSVVFNAPNRYADFNVASDKDATFSIDNLIVPVPQTSSKPQATLDFISPAAMMLIWAGLATVLVVLAIAWRLNRRAK